VVARRLRRTSADVTAFIVTGSGRRVADVFESGAAPTLRIVFQL